MVCEESSNIKCYLYFKLTGASSLSNGYLRKVLRSILIIIKLSLIIIVDGTYIIYTFIVYIAYTYLTTSWRMHLVWCNFLKCSTLWWSQTVMSGCSALKYLMFRDIFFGTETPSLAKLLGTGKIYSPSCLSDFIES